MDIHVENAQAPLRPEEISLSFFFHILKHDPDATQRIRIHAEENGRWKLLPPILSALETHGHFHLREVRCSNDVLDVYLLQEGTAYGSN